MPGPKPKLDRGTSQSRSLLHLKSKLKKRPPEQVHGGIDTGSQCPGNSDQQESVPSASERDRLLVGLKVRVVVGGGVVINYSIRREERGALALEHWIGMETDSGGKAGPRGYMARSTAESFGHDTAEPFKHN